MSRGHGPRPVPPIRTAADLARLSLRKQEARERALEATALSRREGWSLAEAARRSQTTPRTVLRYAGPGWQREDREWVTTPEDRQFRRMVFVVAEPTPEVVYLDLRNSRTSSTVALYWIGVRRWLRTGDPAALAPFRGKVVRVGGRSFPLVTDPRVLVELADRGELEFEALYADVWT